MNISADSSLLFLGVNYYLSPSIPQIIRDGLSSLLEDNGATTTPLSNATHIITNTEQFEDWQTVEENVSVVTDKWVERSIILGKAQPTQYYSADPAMLFSGVVACATELSPSDLEVISAGITALGGQWREGLTKDVTHLFALSTESNKYTVAMHHQEQTHVKVLLPHWFDDAVRLGTGNLPTTEYEWPDPAILKHASSDEGNVNKKVKETLSHKKKTLYKTATVSPGKETAVRLSGKDVWEGRRVLLSPSLDLSPGRRLAVEAGVQRAGGLVVEFTHAGGNGDLDEETKKIGDTDILVTRYRSGLSYAKAVGAGKTIGTLAWMFYVQSTGVVTRPTDQLLHYPIPRKPIEGFSGHEITVTNYTGESREYLKKLIMTMGAKFTPSMSGRNTVVIAAFISGNKTTKARNWSIPIVNHTWLEDCFVQWRNLTVALEKYIVFPPGVDFSVILGERGFKRGVFEDAEIDLGDDGPPAENTTDLVRKDMEPLVGTASSAKDAKEVEQLFDADVDVIMGGTEDTGKSQMDMDVDGDDDGEVTTSKRKLLRRRAPKMPSADPSDENFQANAYPEKTPEPASKRRLIRRSIAHAEVEIPKTPASTKAGRKAILRNGSASSKKIKLTTNEDTDNGEPDDMPSRRVKPVSKSRPRTRVQEDDDTDPASDLSPSHKTPGSPSSTSKGKGKATMATESRTPKRVLSVLVPSVQEAYTPSPAKSANTFSIKTKEKATLLARTVSIRAAADESPVSVPSKRGRPSAISAGLHKASSTSRDMQQMPLMARTPSRRSAATKATQRLHNEIMPDVMNYQQEMKKGPRARDKAMDRSLGVEKLSLGESGAESGEEQPEKKRRVSVGESSKQGSVDARVDAPKKAKRKKSMTSELYESDEDDSRGKSKTATSSGHKPIETKTIKVMTTAVQLSDDVIKGLTKLGIKMTTKPGDCTHLIADKIARTEKLLCAMAVSPSVLTSEWARASAAAGRILPEAKYLLTDPESEKKYGFKLGDALRRGKHIGGRLFKGKTFYVTPAVRLDPKLLRSVVVANGGQLSIQTPTVRILKGNANRHVISCEEDSKIWQPLARAGFTIYSAEFVLSSALKQDVDWETPGNKVKGSDN